MSLIARPRIPSLLGRRLQLLEGVCSYVALKFASNVLSLINKLFKESFISLLC